MAGRRKKPIEPKEEKVEEVIVEKPTSKLIPKLISNNVRKLIVNPLRLNKHIILSDDKAFSIPGMLLKDEMLMTHIEYLISLKKLERV